MRLAGNPGFDPWSRRLVRVFAAWGLGRLGEEQAIRYLATMLDDPGAQTPTSYDPGESIRAPQALCDI